MKKILLLVAVFATALSLNAQRTVDIEVSLSSPANGDPIRAGKPFDMTFTIKNNGPDIIKSTDTLATFLVLGNTIQTNTGSAALAGKDIAKDSSITITRTGFNVSGGSSGNLQVCALAVLVQRSGADTVIDNTTGGNNVSCATAAYSVGLGEELNSNKLSASSYPNPVSNEGTITYTLVNAENVSVKIFDMAGRMVANVFEGKQDAGEQAVKFDASNLESGIYFYQLNAGEVSVTNKVIVKK
jgi:hypothetical protein